MNNGTPVASAEVNCTINGRDVTAIVPVRLLLTDFLRDRLRLTGTHVGCEQGACGACTILFDDQPVRACLLFAVQADGHRVTTIEGLSPTSGLSQLQESFRQNHALQCGFCTPGFIVSITAFLRDNPTPTDKAIQEAVGGHLCRCTGYVNIIAAIKAAVAHSHV